MLPEGTEIGQDISKVLGLDDEILEFDLTPNRSDCLSMIGAAYEVSAILGREVKLPDPKAKLLRSVVLLRIPFPSRLKMKNTAAIMQFVILQVLNLHHHRCGFRIV